VALGLDPNCLKRLKEVTFNGLVGIKVDHEVFLDYQSTFGLVLADSVPPTTGSLRARLEKFIGELPVFSFLFDSICRELHENFRYNLDKKGTLLKDISGYDDLNRVAERLIDDLESLPWSFLISLELPTSIGKPLRSILPSYVLGSNVSLVCPDEEYDKTYSLHSLMDGRNDLLGIGTGLLGLNKPRKWNTETTYLQVATEGFIGYFCKTTPLDDAIAAIKSFLGLALAVRLFQFNEKKAEPLFDFPQKKDFIVHRKVSEGYEIWSMHELASDLPEAIARLEIHNLHRQLEQDKVSEWIRNRLLIISRAFLYPTKSERILLAAQWLLDSYIGKNELLSFVQSTVAMEIMLGEEAKSDVIGIGELLRNRCAYLIGESHDQRVMILKDFDQIYAVRSRIVHRGKSRLNNEESELFRKLQWMCRRVISKELDLIGSDSDTST
jgi:hypothetical protein